MKPLCPKCYSENMLITKSEKKYYCYPCDKYFSADKLKKQD